MESQEPRTLREAIIYFSVPENCLNYLVPHVFPNGVPTCPTCGSTKLGFLKNQLRWQCSNRHPKRQFSVKVGTIFEESPLGLDMWLPAMWLILNCKNGVSSCKIARALGVTQKTAWFMLHRIRLAQQGKQGGKLGGSGNGVEMDETFIGGKARNMHKAKRARVITGTGGKDKTIVLGMLERGGNVRAMVGDNRRKPEVHKQVREHVEAGSAIFSDDLKSYDGLSDDYQHAVILLGTSSTSTPVSILTRSPSRWLCGHTRAARRCAPDATSRRRVAIVCRSGASSSSLSGFWCSFSTAVGGSNVALAAW
jgi:transposase-like protein